MLSLIDHLIHLPKPPQILYLAPFPSPLPESLTTLIHTIRLTTTNPLAQLHCEPMPPTPAAVRDFAAKWGNVSSGMTGEGGRRIDAMILGYGWELGLDDLASSISPGSDSKTTPAKRWTPHEYHFHLVTSLLPNLLKQPPERNIRIISLIAPTYASALPTLLGKRKSPQNPDKVELSGAQGITTIFFMAHVQRILNTLSAAALKLVKEVPNPDGTVTKKVDGDVQSNIMAITVVMPWSREEIMRPMFGVQDSWARWLLWIILFPLFFMLYPSPRQSIQSILFALQAPVRYGPLVSESPQRQESEKGKVTKADGTSGDAEEGEKSESDKEAAQLEPRRRAVGAGDVVRDSAVAE